MKLLISTAAVLVLALASAANAQLQIEIVSDPPLPVENLLKNPGFDEGNGISGWLDEMHVGYLQKWEEKGGVTGGCVRVECLRSNILSSGFIVQKVSVDPNAQYVGGASLRMRYGKAFLRLKPSTSAGKEVEAISWAGSPLTPNFLSREMTGSPEAEKWIKIQGAINTESDDHEVTVGLGAFQDPTSIDFDNAYLCKAKVDLSVAVRGRYIRRVVVRDETGQEIWTSGELKNIEKVEQRIDGVNSLSRYEVIALDATGREFKRWYPTQG